MPTLVQISFGQDTPSFAAPPASAGQGGYGGSSGNSGSGGVLQGSYMAFLLTSISPSRFYISPAQPSTTPAPNALSLTLKNQHYYGEVR